MKQRWLTPKDVAERLGITPRAARTRIRQGKVRGSVLLYRTETGKAVYRVSVDEFNKEG